MVSFEEIQAAYYMVAATGVLIAATFYVLSLRETTLNRKAILTNNLMQYFLSEEGALRFIDLLQMQWSDMDDYMKKYDSSMNPKNFAKRIAFWNTCEMLGYQYRFGMNRP